MTERIDEKDLPRVSPAPTAHLRAVQGGKSVLVPLPQVENASALVAEAIAGIESAGQAQLAEITAAASVEASAVLAGLGYLPPVEFDEGLDVESSRFTVTYNGVTYAPVADEVPFTTTGTFDPAQWRVIQGVTATDLGADSGAGMVSSKRSIPGTRKRSVQERLEESISILEFEGADPSGATYSTAAFQAAHDYVKWLGETKGNTLGLPYIEVPGGHYKFDGQLNWTPWVVMRSKGPVLFDFSEASAGSNGIVCNNDTTLPWDMFKYAGAACYWLDGSGGTFGILGPGRTTSTGVGLKLGNFASGLKDYRTSKIRNVWIGQWGAGMQFGHYNTYLCGCEGIIFEHNATNLKTASGTSHNSGERMEFFDSVFGPSDVHFEHDIDAFDINFNNCSFDFTKRVIKLGANSRFAEIKIDKGHIEAVDTLIVDATAKSSVNRLMVSIDKSVVLPRNAAGQASSSSISRKMFDGPFNLRLGALDVRLEARPYLEDSPFFGSDVVLIDPGQLMMHGFPGCQAPRLVLNADYAFQRDAVDTAGSALSFWTQRTVNDVSCTAAIKEVSGKKVLQLVGSSGSNTSSKSFESKHYIPCKAGDRFMCDLALQIGSATGNVLVQAYAAYYSIDDVFISDLPSFRNYIMRDAFNDTTVPNYAEGNSRYMPSIAHMSIAPAGAAKVKMRFLVSQFDGTLNISRARLYRM